MSSKVRQRALAYLRDHQVMTLATMGDDSVWAAAVFYVNRGFDFYFLSAGHTRHARNLELNPKVAAAIHEDYEDWPAIQGVQLEGVVRPLADRDQQAITWYMNKFPFLAGGDLQIEEALRKVNWYQLRVERLYFIDNSRGLGHRDEIEMLSE